MVSRRTVLVALAAAGFLATQALPLRQAWAQADIDAIAFVKSTSGRLVAIVNSTEPLAQKRLRLREVLDATADVDDIARFCLGRFWRLATPEQQQQYVALFHELLALEISGHLGEYQGVRVTLGAARAAADTEVVITTVERPANPPNQVDWVISISTGSPKVVDLLAGGTSLRLTQSADFAAYLARHQYNIHELIVGMQQQIAQNK